jgi:hypothetical protein
MNVQTYKVEFLRKVSEIPDELWDTCFQLPGEGRWWYDALERSSIDDQFTFFYGLIKHLGCPVGIAPVFVMDMPVEQSAPQAFLRLVRLIGKILPSVLSQRTLFVGPDHPAAGRLGFTGREPCSLPKKTERELQSKFKRLSRASAQAVILLRSWRELPIGALIRFDAKHGIPLVDCRH